MHGIYVKQHDFIFKDGGDIHFLTIFIIG